MPNVIVAGLLVAGLALSACTVAPIASAPIKSGRQLAEQKCAGCHAIGFDGSSPNPNAPTFRSLHRRYPVDALRMSFAKGLEVGHRNMPQFTLPPREIDSLVDYLRSLDPCGKPSSDAAAMAACFAPMEP